MAILYLLIPEYLPDQMRSKFSDRDYFPIFLRWFEVSRHTDPFIFRFIARSSLCRVISNCFQNIPINCRCFMHSFHLFIFRPPPEALLSPSWGAYFEKPKSVTLAFMLWSTNVAWLDISMYNATPSKCVNIFLQPFASMKYSMLKVFLRSFCFRYDKLRGNLVKKAEYPNITYLEQHRKQ